MAAIATDPRKTSNSRAAEFLKRKGLSVKAVAEVLEVDPTRVSKWCSGYRRAHAGALYCSVLFLLGQDGEALELVPTDELTATQKRHVIVGLNVVKLCEEAWRERNPTSRKRPSL